MKKLLTKLFNIHFHEWVYYNGIRRGRFEGEPVTTEYDKYRYCTICQHAQEFIWDSQGGCWSYLSDQETKIFIKHRGL